MTTPAEYADAYSSFFARTVKSLSHRSGLPLPDCEEICQSAWVHGFECLSSFRGEASIYTWVNRIAFHMYIMHIRRVNRVRTEEILPEASYVPRVYPDEFLPSHIIHKAIPRLSINNRGPIQDALNDLDTREVARCRHISTTAARIRRLRAIRAIRKVLIKP